MMLALALLSAAISSTDLSDQLPVPDTELATMRGGVLLPNGLNVAIGIDIQTRIDGVLALHTIYSSESPTSGVRIYTDGTTSPRTAATSQAVTTGGDNTGMTVLVSRSPTGTTITPSAGGGAMTVNVVAGPTSGWLDASGQTNVPVVANGPAISANAGAIALSINDQGTRVTFAGPSIEVQHLVGQATGVVIANTANDRTIDTVSSINVNLVGLPADLLGGTLMINRIAAEVASRR
ncbi:hypothetical protein NHF48_023630 [Sphingomonas sp. H160509]|uniref:hypothetical protein n=1 Tax=Sphingomonas sp. H160509 TaxID=2955313 RepID=UPI0010F3C209|nr:hypothetical protein [Sphingomonas sp. H160509]MDD1453255.1 hypothetical protein [Sphingomonas sp. H160509]RYF09743.1 MAG: hypothetical protein EOO77_23095 [Oxalobacteraceae bacterium]